MQHCIGLHAELSSFGVRHESRTERNKREVRGRILAAAGRLFVESGVEATKIEAICDEADIAVRTFFNHFPSKRDVVQRLGIDATTEVAARIRTAGQRGHSTRERLTLFFADSIELSLLRGPPHPELLAALAAVLFGSSDLQAARDAMIELLGEGVAAGDVTDAYPLETLADAVIGTFYRIIIDWANQDDYAIGEQLECACRFLCDSITSGSRTND